MSLEILLSKLRALDPADCIAEKMAGASGYSIYRIHATKLQSVLIDEIDSLPWLKAAIDTDRSGMPNPQPSWLRLIAWLAFKKHTVLGVAPNSNAFSRVADAIEAEGVKNDAKATEPSPARLHINKQGNIATLDGGQPYSITLDAGRCLQMLIEAQGRWVSSADMKVIRSSGERPDKIINNLPAPILSIIKSKTGAGFRLTIFDQE